MATAISMYQAGANTREVAAEFGISHTSVQRLLAAYDVQARRKSPSPSEVAKAVELYAAGEKMSTIGEHLGFGTSTISRALARAGVITRPRRNGQAASS